MPRGLTRPARRRRAEWQEEYQLVRSAYPEGLAWRWPVSESWFRPSLAQRALRLFTGEGDDHWVVRAEGKMVGCAIVLRRLTGWQAIAVALPAWRGIVEVPLLRTALRALASASCAITRSSGWRSRSRHRATSNLAGAPQRW
jgi:hypothetical protein